MESRQNDGLVYVWGPHDKELAQEGFLRFLVVDIVIQQGLGFLQYQGRPGRCGRAWLAASLQASHLGSSARQSSWLCALLYLGLAPLGAVAAHARPLPSSTACSHLGVCSCLL